MPNDNPIFNGSVPLERLLTGQVVDLVLVRDFLDSETGVFPTHCATLRPGASRKKYLHHHLLLVTAGVSFVTY